jgi:DNA repair exonuclease SbcCD nuclease subunit
MARGLFVSDLHAALRLPLAKVDPGGVSSDRLRDVISILEQVRIAAESDEDVAFVAILGDLFDQRHPDGATLVSTSRALGDLAKVVPTWVLPGNHDAVDRDGRLDSLQFYRELDVPGLHVLGHERVEAAGGVMLHAVPWLPEERARKRIRGRAKEVEKNATNVLCFHQGIRGALWDSGRASDDGLDGDIGDAFDLALTGHYHRPQEFSSGRFLGSPLDLRFGDELVEERGFWSVDFSGKRPEMKLIPTDYPRFATIRLDLDEEPDAVESLNLDPGLPPVSYVRIIVEGTEAAIGRARPKLDEHLARVREYELRSIRLDLRIREERRERLEASAGVSLSELTRRYASQFAPENSDPAELADVGVRFLEE